MTTEKLEINPNFFNKLDSLYKGKTTKFTSHPKVKKTFGSTPISVISDNTKKKFTKVLEMNVKKIKSRQKRGTLKGSGNDR